MQAGILVGRTAGRERIAIVEDAEIAAGFGPYVVGFGRMNVRVAAIRRGEDAMVVLGPRDLFADVNGRAVDDRERRAVDEAVDERRGRILKDLLDAAGKLIRRLSPVVVFHRDHEHGLDLLRMGAGVAQTSEQGTGADSAEPPDVR